MLLDTKQLEKLAEKLRGEIEGCRTAIYREAGHEFTIDSPRQLAAVIYDELHLADGEVFIRKNKSGKSTAHSELVKLQAGHPIIPLVLQYREKTKLLSTYVEPLPKLVDEHGRLHTTYRIDTAAGRLSSKNPNLQNIPTRTDEGREIRRAFVAAPGTQLLVVDYSQIELRIAAHLSGDPALIETFKSGGDIHAATATKMGVDRRVAKAINFGVLFGQGKFGLSEALGISQEEAGAFIDEYFHTYAQLHTWITTVQQLARDKGYAETLLGRRRYLAEINGPSATLRSFAERVAINHPIQGTEAEIVGMAMIQLDKKIPESEAKLLLQVHDELVFEVPVRSGNSPPVGGVKGERIDLTTAKKIQSIMTSVIDLNVPIVAEAKVGLNWRDLTVLD